MRVLFVTNGFPPSEIGGTEVLARNVGRRFLENRDEVIVFAPAYSHEQENDSLVEGMRIHRVPVPGRKVREVVSFSYVDGAVDLKFASFLLEAKPEVTIVWHTVNLSARILEVLDRIGVPYILFLNDFHFLCNQINLLTVAMQPCDGPEDGTKCKDCIALTIREVIDRDGVHPAQLGRLRVSTMKRLLGFANTIVAASDFVKEKYVDFGLDAGRISVISPGVDVKSIRSNFKPLASDRLRFGFFGGNSVPKGILDVLEAFRSIEDPSIELILAGQGLNEISPENLPPNTRIIGRYFPEDVGQVLSEIDVLVIPSRCHESYSILAREAAACGVPIIVSDLRAQSDALQDGVNGLCFKAGEPADLAAKVLLLRNDAKLLQSFKNRASTVRSIEQTATELWNLCKDLVRTERVTGTEMERQFSSFLNEGIDRMEEERRAIETHLEQTLEALDKLNQTRTELLTIQDSFGYRVMKCYASRIDRLLPDGTRRGEFRRVVTTSLHIIMEQGIRSYLRLAWKKIGRRSSEA
jgi:glycosyltransferase involved in cell wall biosynthesis